MLEERANRNLVKFNKRKVLYLGGNKLGLTGEVSSAEENLEVLVDKLEASQQRATAVTKANHRLHCISKSKTSRSREGILTCCFAFMR